MKLSRHSISRSCTCILICWITWCTLAVAETARSATASGRDASLVFGYSPHVFYNVDPKDLVGLMEVWTRTVDLKMKNSVKTTIIAYKTFAEAEKALSRNEVDVLVMIPEEYIRLRAKSHLTAVLSADYGMHFYNELFLLVREGGGVTGIEQLRGKSMIVDVGQQGSIPIKWLDSLLTAQVSSNAQGFFRSMTEATKSSQVVMPVFFGQADACLVSRSHYETMVEMNPQLGQKMRILEKSPGFVTGVLAMRKDLQKTTRDAIVKTLSEMHTDPKGKQIMTLFRINRLIPFMPEHLTSVEKVLKERRGKTDSVANRKL